MIFEAEQYSPANSDNPRIGLLLDVFMHSKALSSASSSYFQSSLNSILIFVRSDQVTYVRHNELIYYKGSEPLYYGNISDCK
jgi:hypothetical protein